VQLVIQVLKDCQEKQLIPVLQEALGLLVEEQEQRVKQALQVPLEKLAPPAL
jgi:hypothetical protein